MAEPYLAEIRGFGFNFAPIGWMMCNGQLLPISEYTAVFSLIGTFYGGNGTSTFALPDLRSRAPMHQSGSIPIGSAGGTESVALQQSNLLPHSHALWVSTSAATTQNPSGAVLATIGRDGPALYNAGTAAVNLAGNSIGIAGSSTPIDTHQPSLVINYCIAVQGIFPSRN